MKRYLTYIKGVWYYFIFGPFFMILEACGEFILPYLSANIINVGAAKGDIPYIIRNGLMMALISLCMMILGVLGVNFGIRGASQLAADIRLAAFKKIQTFSFSNIDEFSTGSLITRMTNDISQVQNFTQMLLRGLFRCPVMIVGAIAMSFALEPEIGWIILAILPVLAVVIVAIVTISTPRYTRMQQQIDRLNTKVKETVTNQKVIKSFVREEDEIRHFGEVNTLLFEKSTKALKTMLLMQPLSALIVNGATLAVVWMAGGQIMVGKMEIGSSGCGKSTLVSLIPRLYDVTEGAVYVDQINVKDLFLYSHTHPVYPVRILSA